MQFLPDGLAPFAAYPQFIVYRVVPSVERLGKFDKIPIHPTRGYLINAQDSNNWLSATEAIAQSQTWGADHGVGFVFTDADPFWFLDIDNCLTDSGWSDLAVTLMGVLNGAAVEISQSRRGLHIFGTGAVPAHGCKNSPLGLELYTSRRFVALTGDSVVGNAGTDCSAILPWLITNYFPTTGSTVAGAPTGVMERWAVAITEPPHTDWRGPADDAELLRMMLKSESAQAALGGKPTFRMIWDNDDQARTFYGNDGNAIDAALAQMLTYWTGNDALRMERLMLQSSLVRDKWERTDYLPRTILFARDHANRFLQLEPAAVAPVAVTSQTPRGIDRTGNSYVSAAEQKELFAGCAWVMDAHGVLVPGGDILDPPRFKTYFGGHTFPLDAENSKTTRNAFEAFTESQIVKYKIAHTTCFKPDETPGALIPKNGRLLANTWWPVVTRRQVGDPAPFLRHIAKIIPHQRDQQILLAYMAAVVQHKGIKFQWTPLIQGMEGNGKTLLLRVLRYAVGELHSHLPAASELTEKYNAWLYGKIFIGVDEVYVPDSQREILEILKTWITSETLDIRAMYRDKVMKDICCNFIFLSNHKEAIRKTSRDRRFAPFYTAQQNEGDLERDGMGRAYFQQLYGWLARQDGYAIVSEYLHTCNIPDEFNPANGAPAPLTSSTDDAIEQGRGGIEQEILEAIEQEQLGFRGGWISSIFLDRLLKLLKADRRIPQNKRRDLLKTLGYIWHPGLNEGRVNNRIDIDSGKPKLFIRADHTAISIQGAGEIARAYIEAQQIV